MNDKITFKPRARIMLQLGDQLIRNESIALLELVKNSYDADASEVRIIMKNIDKKENGEIIIEDNGIGMNLNIIKNVWMIPGSDYKEKLLKENKKTPKFGRLPLGEKGIGRFAVHKLGDLIELITRQENEQEIYLLIDWRVFNTVEYLEEVPVEIISREPEYFRGQTGTRIKVNKLKRPWTRGMVREIYRSLNSFSSPFEEENNFRVEFETDRKDWIKGLLSWKDIKEYSLFRFQIVIEGNQIKKFEYKFTPWPTMTKIKGRSIDENNEYVNKKLFMNDRDGEINLNNFEIGSICFKGFIFDSDPKILTLGVQDKKGLKEYLKTNGGVRVYRDGIRVYDYGEPGNDWLGLDLRRVNIPTKKVSNNIIIAAVYLNREKSVDLIEKTNREGFIENDAYKELKRALIYSLSLIEELRYSDKDKIRTIYGLKSRKEPVAATIKELKTIINKRVGEEIVKREINQYLERIEKEYEEMKEILLKSAGAGLTLSIVIHEIEKIIDELTKIIKQEDINKRVVDLVKHLSNMIEGYSIIIKKSEIKNHDLKKLIDQAIFNVEYRFKVHNIHTIKAYQTYIGNTIIKCARNLMINSLINIFDNSIYWLNYWVKKGEISQKKIFISLSEDILDHITIIVADNGPGFTLPPEEIIKPFVSAKPDGMGLGLHIVDEIMKAHGGKLFFPEPDEFEIPDEFNKGAIIAISFKKEGIG